MPPAEGKTQYPLTLKTPYGESVLEKRPERIVAIGGNGVDVETLAALGIKPVLANYTALAKWNIDRIGSFDTYTPAEFGDLPLETIAKSDPDLIIALNSSYTDLTDWYQQLTDIAPVLVLQKPHTEPDWRTFMPALGEAVDLGDAAAAVVEDRDDYLTKMQAEYADVFSGKTVSYVAQPGDSIFYFSSTGTESEKLFLDMGFAPNPQAEKFVDNGSVSPELIGEIDADLILAGGQSDLIEAQPLFQQLPAVRDGRVIIMSTANPLTAEATTTVDGKEVKGQLEWAIALGGPQSAPYAMDILAPIMRDKLEGK